ncbi:hypothetical protein NQZ68_022061 [Dissostichus eleginoides]|nr:hypothetical protein NQZ68_022061 [Dissostichus eleginoides]
MSEFRRIMMSSFLMLLLHFPAAAGQLPFFTVRAGDEVTLPSDNVIHDQDECENTTWSYIYSTLTPNVPLFEDGQIHSEAKAKSDRLRVTENCSLVIKNVTEEDAGLYTCRQFRTGEQQGEATTTGTPPIHEWTSENNNNKETGQDRKHPEGPALWWVLMVSVGLAALIISVVTVHIWTRTKGGKKRMRKNLEQKDEDEDEDEVNYEMDGGPSASV